MEKNKFETILSLIVQNIITEIVENEKISEIEATEKFYYSQVYSMLEQEKSKLWHLSPKAIYDLYLQEKKDGNIIYPEEI